MDDHVEQLEALLRRRPELARIVRLVTLGHSRKRIAAILGKSIHTVNWHLNSLYSDVPGLTALRLVGLVARERVLQAALDDGLEPSPPPDVNSGLCSTWRMRILAAPTGAARVMPASMERRSNVRYRNASVAPSTSAGYRGGYVLADAWRAGTRFGSEQPVFAQARNR
jgi:hypothetical protein